MDFRENAKNLYGCRGIFIPGPTCPDSGLVKHVIPHILHWTAGAGWIAQHYFDYFLFTRDKGFLRDRAMPFMKEVALFYEDFVEKGSDGFYTMSPSISPENVPGSYGGEAGDRLFTTVNATMDFAVMKELLQNLIEGLNALEEEGAQIGKYEEMLTHIPPYQMNDEGAIKEWMHPDLEDNYKHRHQSHLYPIFPGVEIFKDQDGELFKAFECAAQKRLTVGLNQQTGWSLIHLAHVYARLGDGESAFECLKNISQSCLLNNFFSLHNDWRDMGLTLEMNPLPVQLDAILGWSSAVNEMLLFSTKNTIKVFPALPKQWRTGKMGPLGSRCGVMVNLEWDEYEVTIELESYTDQEIQVIVGSSSDKVLLSFGQVHKMVMAKESYR